MQPRVTYTLVGADGQSYESTTLGTRGGHRRTRVYGRLDCAGALRAIAKGGYVKHRVFFADEVTAIAAGYRVMAAGSFRRRSSRSLRLRRSVRLRASSAVREVHADEDRVERHQYRACPATASSRTCEEAERDDRHHD